MDRTTYGLDIAKNVMQLHWIDAETGEIGRKKLARAKLAAYFAQLQPVRIVMEAWAARTTGRACSAAWATRWNCCRLAR